MNRIATEVAKKVFVLLQNRDFYPLARKQIAKHHAGGSATDNATGFSQCIRHPMYPLLNLMGNPALLSAKSERIPDL